MHPVFVDRASSSAYVLVWSVVGLACGVLAFAIGWSIVLSVLFGGLSALFAAALFLPVYFSCRALKPEKIGMATLLSSLVVVAATFGALWALAMYLAFNFIAKAEANFVDLFLMGGLLCALTEAVYFVYIARQRTREAERIEQELRVMAREAELRALRAQLNPHFLFNSLNSISALTTVNPKGAREMCVLLSDFLRKSLRLGERLSVPLSEELDLLKDYFAIEQIRFAPRLHVVWEIDDTSQGAEIPALLLQPLVENAIKHGISQLVEGGTVRIKTEVKAGRVTVLLENPIDHAINTPKGLGLGLRQVHQRLTTHFGPDGRMEIEARNGLHTVRLFFPMLIKETCDD